MQAAPDEILNTSFIPSDMLYLFAWPNFGKSKYEWKKNHRYSRCHSWKPEVFSVWPPQKKSKTLNVSYYYSS